MNKAKTKVAQLLCVDVCEFKPNPLFSEAQRASVRALRFNRFVACAECGKKSRSMWTMLCEFHALTLGSLPIPVNESGKVHPPLTAVCGDHPLCPAVPENQPKPKPAKAKTLKGKR